MLKPVYLTEDNAIYSIAGLSNVRMRPPDTLIMSQEAWHRWHYYFYVDKEARKNNPINDFIIRLEHDEYVSAMKYRYDRN